jgi:peptide/nickel transport system ATP-binding protein
VVRLAKYFQVGGGLKTQSLRALHDASFSLGEREVLALVGESGSGKSTIARLLARLMPPSSGQILFKGRDVLKEEPKHASLAYRGQVQMIFQDPFGSLNPVHSIGYHLERPLLLHRKAVGAAMLREKVHALLNTVDLNPAAEVAAKFPHQLSGGQRQRVAIARALAVDPTVILADEPISMLDVSIRMGVLNLMERLKEERGISYLYITHDIASARYVADRTMVMYAGHIVEAAPSEELMQQPAHPYTQLLLSAVPDPQGSIRTDLPARSGAPKLIDPPPGCPFADRCPKVMNACREAMPAAVDIGARHWVRCHLYAPGSVAPSAHQERKVPAPIEAVPA